MTRTWLVALVVVLGLGLPPSTWAHEYWITGGGVAREESLLLPGEASPTGHFTFGARLGVEAAIGAEWRGGFFGQWTKSRFRVDQGTTEVEQVVHSWSLRLTAVRSLPVSDAAGLIVGPVLEYGESFSEIQVSPTSMDGPDSRRWAGGIRVGGDLALARNLLLQIEYTRLVGGARSTLSDPPVGTSWTSGSADCYVGIAWHFGGR